MANATTQDEIIFKRCAGLDVHQAEITAAVRLVSDGGRVVGHTKRFATTPTGLSELRDWLAEFDVTHVAMEGTGVYWEPVYAALRGRFDLTVCNAHHVKNVSGRKTDQSDASWLAQLLSYGVLKKSFVPPDQIRELRELTRTRVHRVEDRTRAVNHIHRLLERIGLKLCSVVSDLQGATAQAILSDLADGICDPVAMAAHAQGKLKSKRKQLEEVLQVRVSVTMRKLLRQLLDVLTLHTNQIEAIDQIVREAVSPYAEQMRILLSVRGIDFVAASAILAEIGPDMSVFDGSSGLSSWAGVAPGNHESAGKRKRVSVRRGNRYLTRMLFQIVLTISKTKTSNDLADYFRKKRSRGFKKAAVATSHKLLVRLWRILTDKVKYAPPPPKPLTQKQKTRRTNRFVEELQRLGFQVQLTPQAA
jgi:transposase